LYTASGLFSAATDDQAMIMEPIMMILMFRAFNLGTPETCPTTVRKVLLRRPNPFNTGALIHDTIEQVAPTALTVLAEVIHRVNDSGT
jgi:hypothetical protein